MEGRGWGGSLFHVAGAQQKLRVSTPERKEGRASFGPAGQGQKSVALLNSESLRRDREPHTPPCMPAARILGHGTLLMLAESGEIMQ